MKRGFLVALCIFAASMLIPQEASAVPQLVDNQAKVMSYVNVSGSTVSVSGVTASARVIILIPVELSITKLARNVTRGGPLTTVVAANSNEIIEYVVTITNSGDEPANDLDFEDTIPVGLTFCDSLSGIPNCQNPMVLPAGSGSLDWSAPPLIVDSIGDPIRLDPAGEPADTVTLTYTAQVD